jgi:phosphate transport system permease protein
MNAPNAPTARRPSSPQPTFIERLQKSLLRATVSAIVLSLAFVVLVVLAGAVGVMTGTRDALPDIRVLAPLAGLVAATVFILLAPALLLLSTRPMQDRAFTVVGFLATFFGLAMLLVFFLQLSIDVVDWFRLMPLLIERENQRLLEAPRNFEKQELARASKELSEELAKIDADATKSAAEKKDEKAALTEFFDTEVIPEKRKDLQATVEEMERAAKRDVRTDTTPGALFWYFLTNGPSDAPQEAGIWPALLGSLWIGCITLLFAVPVGVGAAIYLEEYRANTRLSRLIQVNINNLAGVPSVVYGILGALVFVELIFRHLEDRFPAIAARNVLGGGLTLGLLTLPVIIVSSQEALRAVPSSIRQGAIALGATRWQTTWRTVLPMSLPGILTGTILSLARAIGEAAPLVLFGALLFVNQEPSLFSRFTILPMQIFGWADRPPITLADGESVDAWKGNAAMASVILLVTLLAMNAIAIYLRNRAQRRTRY